MMPPHVTAALRPAGRALAGGWLQAAAQATNSPGMSLRFFSAVLIALALFLSPAARLGDSGVARAAPVAAAQPLDGHCPGSKGAAGAEKSGINVGCASACAAVHAVAPSSVNIVEADHAPLRAVPRPALNGISTESETPPPRA